MISFYKVIEKRPFLESEPIRDLSGLQYLYASLRQGLFQYFKWQRIDSVLIPDYVPEGVYAPFKALGLNIYFYHIHQDFSVNPDEVHELLTSKNIQVFVYIHYYGLYHEKNVAMLRDVIAPDILVIEDFAHTIYNNDVSVFGDIAIYSFTKMCGVPEGSLMWFKNRSYLIPKSYNSAGYVSKRLSKKLKQTLFLEHIMARYGSYKLCRRANPLLINFVDYYDYLMRHYVSISNRASYESIIILNRLNFEKISKKKMKLAKIYLEGLQESFLLSVPKSCYTAQALYAFPIQVSYPDRLSKHLIQNDILSFSLTGRHWWFTEESKKEPFFDQHCLLPLNHYLYEKDIQKVVGVVNAFGKLQ